MTRRLWFALAVVLWSSTASAQFVSDTFTDADNTSVENTHTGETGADWTDNSAFSSGGFQISNENRAHGVAGANSYIYASGTSATAEYDVAATLTVKTVIASGNMGVCGRASTSAETGYCVIYEVSATDWVLWEIIAGSYTNLASCDMTLSAGDYTVSLVIRDASKSFTISGNGSCSPAAHTATNDITAAGRVAMIAGAGAHSDTAGIHVDSITASNPTTGRAAHPLTMRGIGP